jgi:hypothetical protein
MDHITFIRTVLDPGLELVASVGGPPPTVPARRTLLAFSLQEVGAGLSARYQNSPSTQPGPARGFWQFETAGVTGVFSHQASRDLLRAVCDRCTVVHQVNAIWRALEGHDTLAAAVARLLLWTHPQALPSTESQAWDQYMFLWRPGRPHPQRWAGHWAAASSSVA